MRIHDITLTLKRKNIKHMYLRVLPPNGEVTLTVPITTDKKEIYDFIESKKSWILKKRKIIQEKTFLPDYKYITGEKHYLWGEEYTLQLISDKSKKTLPDYENHKIYLPVPKKNTIENRKKRLYELYRQEMKNTLPEIVNKYMPIVGAKPKSVKIRKMVNWGNCKENGEITINLKLAKKNPICLEYVTIHELCHLIEFNHGKEFIKLMDEFCPNWKEIKKKLNE